MATRRSLSQSPDAITHNEKQLRNSKFNLGPSSHSCHLGVFGSAPTADIRPMPALMSIRLNRDMSIERWSHLFLEPHFHDRRLARPFLDLYQPGLSQLL